MRKEPFGKQRRCTLAFLVCLLCLVKAIPLRAEPKAVVLASTAPDYQLGDVLENLEIHVPAGASVVFLLATGRNITIKGPYDGKLFTEQGEPSQPAIGLFASNPSNESEIGGTRSLTVGDSPENAEIDLSSSNTVCLVGDVRLQFVRPANSAFLDLEITDPNDGQTARLSWKEADTSLRPWPFADHPYPEHQELTVRSLLTGAEREVIIKRLDQLPRSEAAVAAHLAMRGCHEQARKALVHLGDSIVPLDLYLTSIRGRDPVFRGGEHIALMLQVNRDAYVYCFIRDVQGRLFPLFPPRPDAAKVEGHRLLRLPDRALPVVFEAGPSLRDSEIHCLASEKDISNEMPDFELNTSLQPLPGELARSLETALSDLKHGALVVTQLTLRVEP